ncbi:hypothetical protein ACCO45_003598 [Purpureocillium lilacinum]|uniref:Uncharacterized protein n=1 Tax=Purpureocillium lilacinum TaxID=33203 RepID=A0ACC4E369_PURLI
MGIFFVTYEGLRVRLADYHMPWGAAMPLPASWAASSPRRPSSRSTWYGSASRSRVLRDATTSTTTFLEYTTALRAIRTIAQTEGFRGLYKGLPISLIKTAPVSAITLWTYERTLKFMINFDSRRETLPL